jgi:hypothetical protein
MMVKFWTASCFGDLRNARSWCEPAKFNALKLRTPRNSFEFRGARTALPQNCSPATLSLVGEFVNDTFVPWEWHEEAKGIHETSI